MGDPIVVTSTEYRRWPVSFTVDGATSDPTGDAVAVAFMDTGTAPQEDDFQSAEWETDESTDPPTYYVRILLGPGGVELGAGTFYVWLRVVDDPEAPVLLVDSLTVFEGSLSFADLAAIRARIGAATPPTDTDLAVAFDRLGSADAVALEVMRGRYADALAGPAKWSVEGDFSIDNTATIAALSRQVAALEGDIAGPPVMTVHSLTRSDPWR